MAKTVALLNRFNRGIISPLALARVDLDSMPFYAETMTNWMPRILGSMQVRPGLGYTGKTYDNNKAKHLKFIFSITDTAIIELTDSIMRVKIDDAVVTRPSVSSQLTNGTFDSSLTGWSDESDSGASAAFQTGGYAALTGTNFGRGRLRQQVSVGAIDIGVEHAVRIVVTRGPVICRIGSTSSDDDYVAETTLGVGTHSLSFTPDGDFHVTIANEKKYAAWVDSVVVESSGAMTIATPWEESDLPYIRYVQSADVVYVGCKDNIQYKIERRSTRSWSLVKYQPEDGPFGLVNTKRVSLTASDTTGDITLTASKNVFRSGDVGGLYKLDSVGQNVTVSVTAENQWSDPILVQGVDDARKFDITRAGTWSATVTLQRSIGDIGNWADVTTYTSNATVTYDDGLDNQIIYYRIGVDTGDFTSGTADLTLDYANGSITGIVRITGYTSPTSASASVLKALGSTSATEDWHRGTWSDRSGYPYAVGFYDGRLIWAGKDKIFASVSDAYESFDIDVEGDSGPIIRSIGSGPVDDVNWLLPLYRLIMGGQLDEWEVRSSALDEPITPSNFSLKAVSNQGSSAVQAIKVDNTGVYIQRSGRRIFELGYSRDQFNNYESDELTKLYPEAAGDGNTFTLLEVQRQPDTRIHALRSDGKVMIFVRDKAESIRAATLFETDGVVEDIVIMPGAEEDSVYYCVKRTINGSDVRYLEKWALESEAQGAKVSKIGDSFVESSASLIDYGGFGFNGSNYLDGHPLTGIVDGKKGSFFCIVRFENAASAQEIIIANNAARIKLRRSATGLIAVTGVNSAGTTILDIDSTATVASAAGTYVIMASWDLSTSGSSKMWVNNSEMTVTVNTFTDDFIDYTQVEFSIGGNVGGGNQLTGDIYSLWFNSEDNLDFSSSTVRGYFATSSNVPVYLGENGELPTGETPILFLGYDSYTSWPQNKGSGSGTFTQNGTPQSVGQALSGYASGGIIGTRVTGFDHLIGETVTCWGYENGATTGKYLGDLVVDADGEITLAEDDIDYLVGGLNYTADFKSSKLAYGAQFGTALAQKKIISEVGLIGQNICAGGLQVGQDFNNLDYLPVVEEGDTFSDDYIYATYDNVLFDFNGDYDTDPRLCLRCQSPFAATVLAVPIAITTNERA